MWFICAQRWADAFVRVGHEKDIDGVPPSPLVPVVCVVILMSFPCRFVCDFVGEVPDTIFYELTHAGQAAFESANPATGLKSRLRAQYYVMAMHNMSLADALTMFKVGICASVWARYMLSVGAENGSVYGRLSN